MTNHRRPTAEHVDRIYRRLLAVWWAAHPYRSYVPADVRLACKAEAIDLAEIEVSW